MEVSQWERGEGSRKRGGSWKISQVRRCGMFSFKKDKLCNLGLDLVPIEGFSVKSDGRNLVFKES